MSKHRSRGMLPAATVSTNAPSGRKAPFRHWRLPALLMATTALPLVLAMPAQAEVCDGGTTIVVDGAGGGTQASPWNTTSNLTLGLNSECELTIQNGGEVNTPFNTGNVTLGVTMNSRGTLTVTGENSALTLTGSGGQSGQPGITVGYAGIGTMTISDGGHVKSFRGTLGYSRGSVGTVTVTDNGSRWETSGVTVGGFDGGEGHLTISAGGVVTASGQSYVGYHGGVGRQNGSQGTVLVTGAGSRWENAGNLNIGSGSQQGGAIGDMTIADGGVVTSNSGAVGVSHADARGTVTVTGAGSRWEVGDIIEVGAVGRGELVISNGGVVEQDSPSSQSLRIGSGAGFGRVEVLGIDAGTGDRSHLSLDGILHVGYQGSGGGELLISGGALVESAQGWMGAGNQAYGTPGVATVTGAGSEWVVGDAVELGNHGQLTIAAGGSVQSARGVIGSQPGNAGDGISSATVNVTGAGSEWMMGNSLIVGRSGRGVLTVSDEGRVRVGADGSGTIEIARDSNSTGLLNLGAAEGDAPGLATLEAGRIAFGAGDGTFVINRAQPVYQLDAVISGPAGKGVIRHLAGTTVLTSDSRDFRGATILSGGALHIEQVLGGDVEVGAGTRLSGGSIGGSVDVSGGTLAPGNSPGLMTIGGNLVLDAASTLDFELGAPTGTPGVDSDLIQVANHLTLDGTLNVADAGGFGEGLYRLIDYGGTLTDNGLDIGTTPTGFDSTNLIVQTSIDNQVNLLVGSPVGPASFYFWDGPNTAGNGDIDGGTGFWTAPGDNWTIADGSANGPFDPNVLLIFARAPGQVTVDDSAGAITVSAGMQFAVDGYSVSGDDIRLDNVPIIRVGDGTAAGGGMTATIASTITGADGLTKTDLGTLVLTGTNAYTGGTTIEAGTLRVSADSALGDASGGVTLNGGPNGATLAFAASMSSARDFTIGGSGNAFLLEGGAVTLSGLLSGSGDLAKRGANLLHYTGDGSGFTGNLSLIEGGMRFDGTLAGSVVTSAGTTLSGIGEVGSLHVGGRLEPGASIGTFTISGTTPPAGLALLAAIGTPGDLTLASGSTYVVELNDAGNVAGVNNDLVVADTGTIESGVTILVTPENGTDTGSTYTPGTTYTVIQTGAAGNLTVDADPTITDDFAFLDFTGNTDGQNYYLTSHQVASFCRPGMTFNQCSTANAVEDLGAGHLAYDSVLHLSTAEADAAFDAMSGEVHASGQHVIDQTFALFNRTLRYQGIAGIGAGNFGANVASAPAGDYADARVRGAWAAPLGAYGRIDSDGNAARLEWWNAGLAGGYEGVIDMGSGNAVGGFGFGYIRSHGSIPDRRSTFDGDGIYLGAYGAWNDGPWTVAGALSYGANRVSTERGIVFGTINETATADYWAHTVGLSGEAAYAFDLSDSTKLAPLFTLDAGWSGHGGFTERGAGVFNLSSGSESWTRFDTGIGLALTHTVLTEHGKLTLEGRAVWEHAFADVVPDTMNSFVGGTPFEIRGPAAAADRLRIGGGLSWAVSDDMTIRARYDGLFSGDQSNHSASLGLNVRF